jgi:hypothetical protein
MPTQDANSKQEQNSEGGKPNEQQGQTQTPAPVDFEKFIKTQSPEIQAAFEGHVTGLRNTVDATRKERDDFSKQLREAAKNLEKGSKLETDLQDLATRLESANTKAAFYEDAPAHECRNPKIAFAVMKQFDLVTRSGDPDWKAIRDAAPEAFGKGTANANAGAGTQQQVKTDPHSLMNDFIRSKGK